MKQETLKLALAALKINLTLLKKINPYKNQEDFLSDSIAITQDTITAIKEALAQPEQEPAVYGVYFPTEQRQEYCEDLDDLIDDLTNLEHEVTPLYTSPPQRTWVVFPTMLRKMWSGGEVQAWLDENVNKEKNT